MSRFHSAEAIMYKMGLIHLHSQLKSVQLQRVAKLESKTSE